MQGKYRILHDATATLEKAPSRGCLGLGFIGSIAGGGPLAASIGGIADESLAGSLLTGLLGGFSLNFGVAGLTWDISTLIANLLNGPNCSPAE